MISTNKHKPTEKEKNDELIDSPAKRIKTQTDSFMDKQKQDQKQIQPPQKICAHMCEKKRRRCKFSAVRGSDFCVEHIAYNKQVGVGSIIH